VALPAITRRGLIAGAVAGSALAVAVALWPKHYDARLDVAPGETALGAFLKIDASGQIIVVVPQAELGQGVFTQLAQCLADELGADWRTVAVQPAPPGPLYANLLLAREAMDGPLVDLGGAAGAWVAGRFADQTDWMLTGGSTSLQMFADAFRQAGAAARLLLCRAAARRWDVSAERCDIVAGLITDGQRQVTLAETISAITDWTLPDVLPLRQNDEGRLRGESLPRLDVPAKIDGSANFAADIRLPEMIFAAIRMGPVGGGRLTGADETAAKRVPDVLGVVRQDRWIAVTARNSWAAERGAAALKPAFAGDLPPVSDAMVEAALDQAIKADDGQRFLARGDLEAAFEKARIVRAEYAVAPLLHLATEPMAATARVSAGQAEVWMACQAPVFARRQIAQALDMAESQVSVYPVFAGGSFGRKMEAQVGVQAALIARAAGVPVQLQWSREEDIRQDLPHAAARAVLAAKLGAGGRVDALLAKLATPTARAQSWRRVRDGQTPVEALVATTGQADERAVVGFATPYAISAFAVDHLPARVPLPAGRWRGNAHHHGAFAMESFLDELAQVSGVEPLSLRMQMLGKVPALARCLSMAASMAGWQGGVAGSGQGLACHSMNGAHIALVLQVALRERRPHVERMVAVIDGGRIINPAIARQQIEGGLIFGIASALGGASGYEAGQPRRTRMSQLGLPRLADVGEIEIEFIPSDAPPAGLGELGVPPAAPALGNALATITGRRFRRLPFPGIAS
jgi:isoquinoline 1-oxidoreductase subunit beta